MYGGHHPYYNPHGAPRRPPPPPNYFHPQQPPPNPYFQNPNPYYQLPPHAFFQHQPNPNPNPNQPHVTPSSSQPPEVKKASPEVTLQQVEQAVKKAHRELLASGEGVTTWKVSHATLLSLKSDSWNSLGFQMQQIPSLFQLMLVEGKVNAFIHCFVGVRRITSLKDLDVEICKNEGVQQFDELELGPLLRHPLVIHYFLVPPDTKDIVNITSEQIISYLVEYMDKVKHKGIKPEEFLDFLAEKRSLPVKEKLGVRIQNLRMHVTSIREARRVEESTLSKYIQSMKKTPKEGNMEGKLSEQPSISMQKKNLRKRYFTISKRVKSFSPIHKDTAGKHITFISSSEDEDDENDFEEEDVRDEAPLSTHTNSASQSRNISDQRVSNCPYPSVNEEKARLGMKTDMGEQSLTSSDKVLSDENRKSSAKKRKLSNRKVDYPLKMPKRNKLELNGHSPLLQDSDDGNSRCSQSQSAIDGVDKAGYLRLGDGAMEQFITTWKEACRIHSIPEVLDKMLYFYNSTDRRRKNLRSMFKSFPCIGLLHVAVISVKYGMWDNLYDTLQGIGERECITSTSGRNEPESISIEPPKEVDALSIKQHSQLETGISIDDVSQKISNYFELNYPVLVDGKSAVERQFIFLKNLHECQIWLTKQFSVKKFRSLGYGEFYRFLEEHPTLIPNKVFESLFGDVRKSAFEVSMLQHHLMILLSQAASCLWENESITKEHICKLLKKQFPLISFQVSGDSPLEDFSEYLKPLKNADSFSVLFSATLLGTESISLLPNNLCFLENTGAKPNIGLITGALGSVSANDAIECLLKAPMLSDLHSWTHWDLIYAPSLGPLVDWLLNKVSMKELLCLVTKDGKILRIDHSATVDEFLEALIKASAYEAAVKLLSLFSLYGGERHVPLALLKCHVQRGIEIIMKNAMDQISDESKCNNYMGAAKPVKVLDVLDGGTTVKQSLFNLLGINGIGPDLEDQHKINKAVSVASRFILDCLSYLPSEFHNFAAGVLLSGLQFFIKDAPSEILRQCPQTQRRMLHEIGLSLSISEWVADYQAFSTGTYDDFSVSSGVSDLLGLSPMQSSDLSSKTDRLEEKLASHDKMVIDVDLSENTDGEAPSNNANEVSSLKDGCKSILLDSHEIQDGSPIIESIRQEEFGLVSSLTDADNIILKKQHARLGRALQCLSQELYSQDSHFLLELVQNADDNVYMDSVEPTLIFVLQSTGIVVLNNERGFTAQNIRALCDVGNSTKKGLNAGYIGKKGIGFKSVFRVTDAPEIHSNGFHVKFDISEGQIGFVLPTVVAPCDIVSLRRLLPGDQTDSCWNTCIVLPFKSKLRDGMGLSSIVSLFSDLHPSLLLFLHRLQCIKFRNMLNDTYTVMKRENLEDGIVKVSHGEETMSWFVATQSLQANVIRPDVQTTKIAMAFTLKECSEGEYKPHLEQQPVFAFLPLRTYGLKFILQGDFVLPSSREEVDSDSAWNQWLLSEFPGLFVSAQRSFCDLRCFQGRSGRAVAAYMSFVPLVGEVHGFFSQLPRMIISKLRISNCLLVEGKEEWVPPCRVLRNWNKQARILLPDNLLHEHMGLGYLDKDIALSDFLAKALGVNEYGPGILIDTLSSICRGGGVGMKPLGLDWASACLSTLYVMLVHSSGQTPTNAWVEADFCEMLRKIPFIPLSDGTYGSVAEGTIWLTCDADNCGSEGEHESGSFPNLYAKLRIVSPAFLSAAALNSYGWEEITVDNVIKMLVKIGVQRLAAHELVKVHILSALSDDKTAERDTNLMTEYLSFVMLHFQSSCPHCHTERESIISELKTNAFILTNHGYRRPAELPIHFGREFGNPIDMTKFFDATDSNWHEIDTIYLKQSRNNSLSFGLMKWREFFQELDITDFVQTVQVEKNITDVSHTLLRDIMWDEDPIASGFVVKDWESPELVHLLSALSSQNNQEKSQYLLEVLDGMWDGCYSAKVAGCYNCKSTEETKQFKSSFLRSINDVQWMASSIDQKLHYPRDLFYDCEEVRSILGNFAPYAVPQVRSRTISRDIELKTRVTIDDALRILEVLQSFEAPVNASIDQMSKFYAFIWRGTSNTKGEIASRFASGPSIFVPFIEDARNEDVRSGKLFSSGEVCWYDPTGAIDLTRDILLQSGASRETGYLINMTLIHVYQGLHDFFVKECKVCEIPTSRSYIQILSQLSKVALPSQAANIVFRVLLKWANDLKAGLLETEDVIYLKECLYKSETAVLPTVQDKWVSLHPSSGLICWSDSEELWKQFKDSDNINFLYFGTLSIEEKEALPAKLSGLMQALGVPSLSEVITREAIFYGMDDCREKALLVNWVLLYAQRYIFKLHPDRYNQLKQSGFEKIWDLKIVVVEKLYYRRAVKGSDNVSSKRIECSCLLQGNTLYIDRASKSHPIFMELSRLFFSGAPERHLANFLHMITTMAESGSTEEQTEFFVVDSQEIPELPDEEPVWFLSSLSTHQVDDGETHASIVPSVIDEQNLLKFKRKPGSNTNWPPADWKTAPDFSFARETRPRTKPAVLTPSDRSQNEIRSEGITFTENQGVPGAAVSDWIIEDTPAESETGLVLNDLGAKEDKALFGSSGLSFGKATSSKESNKASGATIDGENLDRSHFSERDELSFGTPNEQQAALTGRTGELVAFRYFTKKVRSASVKWVNKETETGLPYDIVIGDREESMEYIEVKATKSAKKDWFAISTREWQFAAEKGDSFSIAHILLTGPNKAKVSVFKNPVRLCQKSTLRLAVLMPKSEEGESHVT